MATNPDTPYFHVGLNCPPPRRSWLSGGVKKISWGVGIQVRTTPATRRYRIVASRLPQAGRLFAL